jgi:hypothetical protein
VQAAEQTLLYGLPLMGRGIDDEAGVLKIFAGILADERLEQEKHSFSI